MKKKIVAQIVCFLHVFFISQFLFSQNTFPASGNTGIGTASPSSLLEVVGNVNLTGASGSSLNLSTGNVIKYKSGLFLHTTGGSDQGLYLGELAGANAGTSNNGCTAIGYYALNAMSMGNHNTAEGWRALLNMNGLSEGQGDKNSMFGSRAGESIYSGSENVGIGWNVFYKGSAGATITGKGNIAIGGATASGNGVLGKLTNGNYNTVIGHSSATEVILGYNNLILGYFSATKLTDGYNNIILGYNNSNDASIGLTTGYNNILIGNSLNTTANNSANQLNIGGTLFGNLSSQFIGVGSTTLTSMFNVGTAAQFQVSSSGDLVKIKNISYSFPSDDGDAGESLQTNGSGNLSWEPTVDVQVFTTTGANTWTKPAGAKSVTVIVIGAGGGGGSGSRGTTGVRSGGAGGGAGGYSEANFNAAVLGATETIIVGAGGNGGTAVSADGNGNNGSNGSKSAFGDYLRASGGAGGEGGSATGASGGSGGPGNKSTGGAGASASSSGGGGSNAGNANYASIGGGSGGGINTGGASSNGGDGGGSILYMNSSPAAGIGGTDSGNGNAGNANTGVYLGTGGGGGSSSASANAGAGGAGANYGAGGGGGGAVQGFNSGAGGNGANGLVIVISYL